VKSRSDATKPFTQVAAVQSDPIVIVTFEMNLLDRFTIEKVIVALNHDAAIIASNDLIFGRVSHLFEFDRVFPPPPMNDHLAEERTKLAESPRSEMFERFVVQERLAPVGFPRAQQSPVDLCHDCWPQDGVVNSRKK